MNEEKKDDLYYLKGLNIQQKEAVMTINGPLLILAGAGAGKTKTITHRILHIIKKGVGADKILAITFTNKAASEMKERVHKLLQADPVLGIEPGGPLMPFLSTFHSLGVKIIRENCHELSLPRQFTIFDKSDSKQAIKTAMGLADIDPKQYEPSKIASYISKRKGLGENFREFEEKIKQSYFEEIVQRVWSQYDLILKKEKALDFDDLLLETLNLIKRKEIREKLNERWHYIHIDEYQDTNRVQYDIAKIIAGPRNNIAVVGDIDQCLVAGTKITLPDKSKKDIGKIKVGDNILSNYGSGDYRPARVTEIFQKKYHGETITILTESGKKLESTPEHTHFGGFVLGHSPQYYFTYLMYKKNKGYRIGVSQTYTKGQKKSMVGFKQRCNQEHGDKVWIIGTFDNQNDARILEHTLSLEYSLPTIPFVARKNNNLRGNGIVHDQKIIDSIFRKFDTETSAEKLLSNYGFLINHPHHLAQSKNSNRNNITITLCGDRRGKKPTHRISMVGNDSNIKTIIERAGFKTRFAKKGSRSWRFETCRTDFGEVVSIVSKINSVISNLNIIKNARLGKTKSDSKNNNSLSFFPAKCLVPGMVVFNEEGNYEIIKKIERRNKKIKVYDLNIENTHNFIANGIVTHNSIYSWRGADFKNIMRFEKDYPDTKLILLEENYRSTKNIIAAANAIISKNVFRKEKNLFTGNPDGDKISIFVGGNEKEEARYIARTVKTLIRQGVGATEIAVLFRANFQSRVLEEAFLREEVSYELIGTKFFERKEVKDVISYLKLALNPDSDTDLKRAINNPSRGIGKVTLLKIIERKEEDLPKNTKEKINNFRKLIDNIAKKSKELKPSETIKFIIKESGIDLDLAKEEDGAERIENVRELASIASIYDNLKPEEGIEKFLDHVSLSSDQDEITKKESIKLMTVHASKGLEFDYVFVTGLEQDLFPHEKKNEQGVSEEDAEEERRLFYVAVTRARNKLFLTYAITRTIFGSMKFNDQSEFLKDIDDDLTQKENFGGEDKIVYIDF